MIAIGNAIWVMNQQGAESWDSNWDKTLSRNADIVLCAGYLPIGTTNNLDLVETVTGYTAFFFNVNNLNIIRQSGNLIRVQLRVHVDSGSIGSLIIAVYRKDGFTWDRIGYEDFVAQITTTATYTLTFTTPIAVLEGDYLTVGGSRGTTSNTKQICATTGQLAGSNRYGNILIPDQNYNWEGLLAGSWVVPIKAYIQAPMAVIIGDSLMSGHGTPAGASFIEPYILATKERLVGYNIQLLNSAFVQQTMAIGGQTSTQITARFAADVVALKPKIAVIEGGVNDIAGGVISKATFIGNYTTMLNACLANDILPVVCKILPRTDGTNEQMQTRDDWMTDLETLVATYTGAVWVDFDATIGKNRVGGDDGNLWDIQTDPDYDDDGVHLTLLGYQKMAEVIDAAITAKGYILT